MKKSDQYPIHSVWRVGHDGFIGSVIGYYTRRDDYEGIVLQQLGTKVVHVYGTKYLEPYNQNVTNAYIAAAMESGNGRS